MAASSAKDKANSLKDSYVAGLIEGGATAPAPTMPEQDLGDQAGMLVDVKGGGLLQVNDNNPKLVIRDGNRMSVVHAPELANPVRGHGYGMGFGKQLSNQEQSTFSNMIYNNEIGNEVDRIYGTSPKQMYDSAMQKPFTPRGMGQGQY